MHLLIYTNKSSYTGEKVGGAETSLRLIAETFAACGHTVTYATTSPSARLRAHRDHVRGVSILYLPSLRHLARGRLPLWLSRRLDSLSGSFRALSAFLSSRLNSDSKVDVVLLYYEPHSAKWFLRRRGRYRYSVILRMAGLDWYERIAAASRRPHGTPRRNRLLRRYEELFHAVDSINHTSAGLEALCRSRAAELGMRYQPADSFVQDIGVALSAAGSSPPGDSKRRPGPLCAICATRFSSYQKRQDLLVSAVSRLAAAGDITPGTFHLSLIGDGSERPRIERMIAEHGLQSLISVEPFLPQGELWRRLREADLLCHPCEYEGLSKIVAESMAMGLPVLASRVVPLTDEIHHGKTGFLVDNTPEAWANALFELIRNPDRLRSVCAPASAWALRRYDPRRNTLRYLWHFRRIHAHAGHTLHVNPS